MKNPFQNVLPLWALTVALGLMPAGRLVAQTTPPDVSLYLVEKDQWWRQTNAGSVTPATNSPGLYSSVATGPVSFFSEATLNSPASLISATITLPDNVSSQSLANHTNTSPPSFFIGSSYASQSALDAAYPDGNYTMTLVTADQGTVTATLDLTGDGYLSPTPPMFSNFAAAQSVNSAADCVSTWNPLIGGTTNDLVIFRVYGTNGQIVFSTPTGLGELTGVSTSVVIPGGTLVAGQSYQAQVVFSRTVDFDATDYPGAIGVADYATITTMSLLTQPPSLTPQLTITPAAISNTYSGTITFQVTGLTNAGDTVVVQKYLDANGDGVVDAGDILWQQFTLTDGQAGMVIGGVTNFNVPGDTDGLANKRITAKLYPQADFSQVIVANYLYVVTSPSNHFSPLTNSLVVTNFPFAQKFTGTVVNNGVVVPNASIILFPASGDGNGPGNPVGGVEANHAGVYSLSAPAGSYTLVAFKPNYVGSLTSAAGLVLTSGATLNTNLSLLAATRTISGQIVDAAHASQGLPGLFLAAQIKNGSLVISTTDTNGFFTLGVTADQYGISLPSAGLAFHGYVGPQNKTAENTVTGNVAGVTLALPKANALIYGTVENSSGSPFSGEVAIYADDNNNGLYQSDGYTDANGNYVTAVLGGLGANDPWNVSVDNSSSFPNDAFSQPALDQYQNGGTNISSGQVVLANITGLPATNYITGNVQFNGTNLIGAEVNADANIGGLNYNVGSVDTDTNGNYSLAVPNGMWSVNLNQCCDNNSLDGLLGSGNYQNPNNDNVTINNDNATANFNVLPPGESGQIVGHVLDTFDNPVSGVNVDASSGQENFTVATDNNGYYFFNVGNGTWDVSVSCSGLNSLGYACVSDEITNIYQDTVELDFTVESGNSATPLAVTTTAVPDALVGAVYSQQLNASGGQAPYTWSLDPGSLLLPPGVLLSTGGVVSGPITTADLGTNYFLVDVTDNLGNTASQFLSLTVYPALTIATSSLPSGTVGTAYSAQVLVSGGRPLYLDNAPDGYGSTFPSGSLPPGLNFSYGTITSSNEYFVISGSPTTSGTFPFTMGAYDADENQVQANYSITIVAASVKITTTSLTNATVGVAYTNHLTGSGGTTPYTWTIATGSQPPPAPLTLATTGVLSGVPVASGTNSFIVRLTDHNSLTTTHTFTLVTNPKPRLSAAAKISGTKYQFLLAGAVGQNYTLQVSTNLFSSDWTTLLITNSTTTNTWLVVDPNATNQQRFYRVLIGP